MVVKHEKKLRLDFSIDLMWIRTLHPAKKHTKSEQNTLVQEHSPFVLFKCCLNMLFFRGNVARQD